jgi:hypothetical protein
MSYQRLAAFFDGAGALLCRFGDFIRCHGPAVP